MYRKTHYCKDFKYSHLELYIQCYLNQNLSSYFKVCLEAKKSRSMEQNREHKQI